MLFYQQRWPIIICCSLTHQTYVQVGAMSYDNGCSCSSGNPCVSSAMIYDTFPLLSGWSCSRFLHWLLHLRSPSSVSSRMSLQWDLFKWAPVSSVSLMYPINLMPLDPSLSKRFTPQTLIGVIIDALMVEEWHWSISHDDYYNVCKPKECSYTVNARKDAISIVTMLLGLIGGLVTALKLIVPRFVQVIRWQFKPKTTPQSVSGT